MHENFISLLDGNLYDLGAYNCRSLYRRKEKSDFIDKDEFSIYNFGENQDKTIIIGININLKS